MSKIMKVVVLITCFFSVTACFSGYLSQTPLTPEERMLMTPEDRIYELQGELNILLHQINTYASQPFCIPPQVTLCANPVIVIKADHLAQKAGDSVNHVREMIRLGAASPDNIAAAAAAARVLVAELSALLIAEGVK